MIDTIIAKLSTIGFIILTFILGALILEMMCKWYMVQEQAQFLAKSQGKYGGYTTSADNSLKNFARDIKANNHDLSVEVSAPNTPVPWGTVVTSKITYMYHFGVGNVLSIKVSLPGKGRSVSTYLEGAYDVVYTSPSY